MWKKLGVTLIALLSTFSVAYAMNRDMFANSSLLTLTGRVSTFSKGDRVIMGTQYKNDYIAMQLLYDQPGSYPANTWFSMTTKPIENNVSSFASSSWSFPCDGNCNLYRDSLLKPYITTLNTSITSFDNSIIKDRIYITGLGSGSAMQQQDPDERKYFIPNSHVMALVEPDSSKNLVPLNANDLSFSVPYYNDQAYNSFQRTWQVFGAKGEFLNIPITSTAAIRPAAYLDLHNIVFALEPTGTSNIEANVEQPVYNSTNVHLSTGNEMKMRFLDTNLNVTFKLLNTNKLVQNSDTSLELTYGDMTVNNDLMISVLLSDEDGNFLYYKNLGTPISGDVTSSIDVSDLPLGKYTVSLVNERMTSENAPTAASALRSMQLEVVEGHTITYTKSPQPKTASGDYEYNKNVEAGMKIGTISYDGKGAAPIHYDIVADGDNTYQNFEIDGLDVNGDSSATSLGVKVKASGAPDVDNVTNSLKAGTYKFCIVSKDANGTPNIDILGKSKVCTSLTVDKTNSTISFTDTTQKDMKIGDSTYTGDITYTNTDTITSSNITYSLTGGVPNMLTVAGTSGNPKKYDANVIGTSGTGLPATFTLSATIAETENYKSATTTINKPIYVYKELSSLTWTPSKNSYSTSDVTTGKTVGALLAVDGIGPYTYALAQPGDTGYNAADAANNGTFKVSGANVETTSNLTAGTYQMQFKVTDAKNNVKYVSVTIKVTAQTQAALEFKDAPGGSIITNTGITIKFNDTNTSLFAEGGSTGATIEYYLADANDQPSGLVGSASDYVNIAKIGGLITPKKVGTVNVYAKSPGNATYGDQVSSFMSLIIEQAEQSVKFANTNATSIKIGDTSQETATGTVTLTNTTGEGGITYKSSDTNIATVDANGKVTAIAKGTAIITATLNDSDPNNTSYNPNYETKTTTKTINVYKGMSLTWTASSPNLKGVSSVAGDLAGTIAVTDNNGNITYTISSNTGVENADARFFQLDPNNTSCGVKLIGSITATDVASHNNTFYIQIDAVDSNKDTQTIDIEITIDNADNDVYFKEGSNKVTKITKQFGENGNAFNLSVNTSNGGSVTYSVVATQPQDVITTLGTGVTTIKKVGTTKAQAVVGAGSGYDGKTISVDVEITKGIQEVTFDDTVTTARAFVKDSQFSEPVTLSETSAKSKSSRIKTYDSKDKSICTVDQVGLVTMLSKGNCEIEVKNTDSNWNTTTATKTINLYDGMGVVFAQSTVPQAETPNATTNSIVGKLTISGGQGNKTSIVSTSSDPKNKDAKFFDVKGTNVVLKQNVTASDLANKYDTVKQKYVMYVQFETKDTLSTTITTDEIIEFEGAPLDAEFDTNGTGKITEVYGKDRIFLADVIHNAGDGTPLYQLKNDPAMPSDVLKNVEQDGTITILNANDKVANANPVMIEAIIPPSGGYEGKTIEVEVEITKAEQKDFKFKTPTIKMQTESTLSVILDGKLSTGNKRISSPNTTILSVNEMEITAGTTEDTLTITAVDDGDRNYKMASATATVIISKEAAYPFIISVPNATYGDIGVKAKIETNGANGANQVQTWVSSDLTIADIDAQGNITIYKAGSVDITCTQTSTGEPSASHTVTMVVKPKPITITINDKDKYVGEQVPVFDMTIPNGVLVGNDTISLPTFSCVDSAKVSVTSTTPAGSYPITGSYATGANPNYAITVTSGTLTVKQDASLANWYHLVGVTSGSTLDPTKWYNEDVNVVLDPAIETAGSYDEISLDKTLWDPISITVTNEDENSEDVYFRINASGILSTSQSTTIKIDKTKPVIKSITGTQTNKDAISTLINNLTFGKFFKPGTKVSIQSEDILPTPTTKVSGVQDVSYEVYEIDRETGTVQTTPKATGNLTPDASGKSEVTLSDVGLYRVCAIAKDNAGNVSTQSCSDVNVKKIDVDIDNDGKNELIDGNKDNCPDINIPLQDDDGNIYKINIDRDNNGFPDMNIDSDGDGIAEINVDTDKDGKPDLNLVILTKWEPTFCVTEKIDYEGNPSEYCTMKGIEPVINVDTEGLTAGSTPDGIPDINIDTKGDFKPHYNVARPGESKPYLNIGKVHTTWTPNQDYKSDSFLYDSMKDHQPLLNIDTNDDGRPDVNIDINNNGEPDLNIDTNGDLKPDINIDGNGDGDADFNLDPDENGNPTKNIISIDTWEPILIGSKDGTEFDTMEIKRKSSLEDQGVTVEKPGGSFLPNYSIKVDNIKDTIDKENKDKIDAFVKEDSEIKDIYDVKLSDGTTVIQPDGSVKVRIPVSEDLVNSDTLKVVVEQKDGSYKEVTANVEDGYIEFETEFLGKVGILGDKEIVEPDPTPEPDDKPDVKVPTPENPIGGSTPDASVKGEYIGGAGTGDSTAILMYFVMFVCSGILLILSVHKRNRIET